MIPLPDQPAMVVDEYWDLVTIGASPSGQDADGAPITASGAAGSALPCSVQPIATTGSRAKREADAGGPVSGVTEYTVRFPAYPGNVFVDQVLNWTTHRGVAKSPADVLTAVATPQQVAFEWLVPCVRRA